MTRPDAVPAAARPALRPGRRRPRGRPEAPALLVLLTWALVVVPRTVQTLLSDKQRATLDAPAPPPTVLTQLSTRVLTLLLVGTCVAVVLRRLHRLPTDRRTSLGLLLTPWLALVVRDAYLGRLPTTPESVLPPLLVVAVWVLRPPVARLALLGLLTGVTAFGSLLLGALLPEKGLYVAVSGDLVEPEKALLDVGVLVGPFTDSNNLGQVLLLGLPAALLLRSRTLRALVLALGTAALVWTSSRSSLAGLAAVAVLGTALSAVAPRARQHLAAAALVVLAAVVALLPLLVVLRGDRGVLTNRGGIWADSLDLWATAPWTGLGVRAYDDAAAYAGPLGGYAFHGHNLAVHALVTGGVLLLVLLALLTGALLGAAARGAAHGVWAPVQVAALLVSCTLEVSYGVVDRQYLLATSLLPVAWVLLAVPSGPVALRRGRPPGPGVQVHRQRGPEQRPEQQRHRDVQPG